ncbi:hypothetical protein BDN70DRAFT_975341 [Pholiota conissans]|uniref:Uncharacterized protein n=1 Tax=Pholiota conissans TaxID=109636 RepID=A0A9P5YQ42_9AGAR|nr:hypothetical protein BDN70DRAFT_975341 [Pholiota conissans]
MSRDMQCNVRISQSRQASKVIFLMFTATPRYEREDPPLQLSEDAHGRYVGSPSLRDDVMPTGSPISSEDEDSRPPSPESMPMASSVSSSPGSPCQDTSRERSKPPSPLNMPVASPVTSTIGSPRPAGMGASPMLRNIGISQSADHNNAQMSTAALGGDSMRRGLTTSTPMSPTKPPNTNIQDLLRRVVRLGNPLPTRESSEELPFPRFPGSATTLPTGRIASPPRQESESGAPRYAPGAFRNIAKELVSHSDESDDEPESESDDGPDSESDEEHGTESDDEVDSASDA